MRNESARHWASDCAGERWVICRQSPWRLTPPIAGWSVPNREKKTALRPRPVLTERHRDPFNARCTDSRPDTGGSITARLPNGHRNPRPTGVAPAPPELRPGSRSTASQTGSFRRVRCTRVASITGSCRRSRSSSGTVRGKARGAPPSLPTQTCLCLGGTGKSNFEMATRRGCSTRRWCSRVSRRPSP
jgi:hypothetical protein